MLFRMETTLDRLTAKERQIAAAVADGKTNREISEELVVSIRTVDAHVEHIFKKLGVNSRVALATTAGCDLGVCHCRHHLPN